MEYKLVFSGTNGKQEENTIDRAAAEVAEKVNRLIQDGWLPQGGVSVSHNPNQHYHSVCLVQALVR